ncbi:NAD-dependent epimerase/dehydratase family protein [Streptomyces sp. M19]
MEIGASLVADAEQREVPSLSPEYWYRGDLERDDPADDHEGMAHVLVTGGTGFLGSHTIARLLTDGHTVTTTVRSAARRPDVERMLAVAGAPHADGVRYVEADLTSDRGWDRAVEGPTTSCTWPRRFPEHGRGTRTR